LGNGYGYQRQRNNAYRPSSFLFNFAVLIYESLETRRVPRDAVSKWSGIELFPPSFSLSICYEVIWLILRTVGCFIKSYSYSKLWYIIKSYLWRVQCLCRKL
jgi:hypothetical protein